ncbi:MAG: DUF4937 domain-containing protein [Algicola sp.]|nr:DUF4937 domain-containing protein [Algicola sp.]
MSEKLLGKLIVCNVLPEQRRPFSIAQQAWHKTALSRGFVGQLGGWRQNQTEPDNPSANQSVILALWQNRQCLDHFMNHLHDEIYEQSAQKNTYLNCKIAFLNRLLIIPAEQGSESTVGAKPALMRMSDCEVLPGRVEHFIEAQKNVWNPNMAQAKGMMGGHFWQFSGQDEAQSNRFLVTTFWQDQSCHDLYVEQHLPLLKVQAEVELDIKTISGGVVELEQSWRI